MTLRRLWVLVSNLPPDSATNTALQGGPEIASWSTTVELLAQAVDVLRVHDHHFVSLNSKTRVPEPEPVTRPKGLFDGKGT